MKRLFAYITLPLLLVAAAASAQEVETVSPLDSVQLGNLFQLKAGGALSAGGCLFEKSPEVDIANALYGQFSGLLVKNSSSTYDSNRSRLKLSLRLRGHSPLLLVDGFPRELDDLEGVEIDKIEVLKDAAAAALYGVKGGNGVISITTKRGKDAPLQVTAKYQYGLQTMFRAPEFADAYTYGFLVNEARTLDGLPVKYNDAELLALYSGQYPYAYPNVNWWNEVFRDHGDNHQAEFTFQGGNRNFRYFAAVDYLKEDFLYKKAAADDRYNANHYDNRLGIRANVDVNITPSTLMKIGVKARLAEFNQGYYSGRIESTLYTLPAAAFPVMQADGVYGGTSLYGNVNPVAVMQENGQRQWSQTKVLADILLRQDLGMLVPGLSADAERGLRLHRPPVRARLQGLAVLGAREHRGRPGQPELHPERAEVLRRELQDGGLRPLFLRSADEDGTPGPPELGAQLRRAPRGGARGLPPAFLDPQRPEQFLQDPGDPGHGEL